MRALLLAFMAALALLLSSGASAEERILHFRSDVEVQRDASLLVTETIRIRAEGESIKRGILRDFPTRYDDMNGATYRVGFEVLGVERDGKEEPWSVDSIDNGERIRIGDADVVLDPGVHEYVIRYRTTRQLGSFDTYDELYWNATGTGWTFPIDVAEARIRLPEPVPFGNRAFYTDPQGSTATNARVVSEGPGEILIRTTDFLGAQEGLTIAVAWPKGIVQGPPPRSAQSLWLQGRGPPAMALLGLLGIAAYYFYAWRRVGRGPQEGTVVPLFSPPDDMSAAASRYVSKMGAFDNRTFAAAIVDLGVRGKLRLVEGEKPWFGKPDTTIEKVEEPDGVPAPEAAMMGKLFSGGDHILMDDANHATFSSAKSSLSEGLEQLYEKGLFVKNHRWSLAGMMLIPATILLVAITIVVTDPELPDRNTGFKLAFLALGAAAGLVGLVYWSRTARGAARVVALLAATLLGVAAVMAGFATAGIAIGNERILPLLAPLLALPLVFSAFWWMAAPTRQGRALMDQVAGFKRYLSITEEERLETMHPPEKTPQLFERYLPHAIALGVENAWASRFTSVLAAAAAAGQAQTMGWYSGHSDPWNDVDGFTDRVGSSLASTVSSASTAPGSSSGSSGGGSSGGGGGGGGGSGW